ncbi:hypothetical protein [Fulvivirga lutea]|uniref:Uncharacterized protein n=1 Tax=Fulvivirga lutea TaxID=2810512 RepID=A0A975A0J2_9BACT|nr:hypothetical protein [Fulvivirga lutea]QSE97255.1 hypothetical protein JR347_16940 [Fulvivirga lutea]
MRKFIILLALYFSINISSAQPVSFELNNSDALLLDSVKLSKLTTTLWKVKKIEFVNREMIDSYEPFGILQYENNGNLQYNYGYGSWELIEKKYLKHQLDDKNVESRLNFGGIYAVIEIIDSTLTLSKVLTSTSDMKRTISLTKYSANRKFGSQNRPYLGRIENKTMDSIRSLSKEELFISGFRVNKDFIIVETPDSVYWINRKSN